jgi:two-component system sensor kinase FixL
LTTATEASATAPAPSLRPDELLAALALTPALVCDPDGAIRFWSAGAEQLYGWPRELALGKRADELLATAPATALAAIDAALRETGQWHGELRQRARDGRVLQVASRRVLQRDAAGAVSGVIAVNQDITRYHEGDAAARRLAAIVESSNDAIVSKSLNGIVTSWNTAAERMLGYRAEEIVGQSIVVLFPADRLGEEDAILARIRRGERVAHYETVRRRKDGNLIPVSLTVSPIRDGSGVIIGASKIVRDLTEREEREARLREAQSDLAHAQRLTELGQLVSTLVHEVTQPMAAIGNYVSAARRLLAIGNPGAAEIALGKIADQNERAHQIIQRLRNFVSRRAPEHRAENLATMAQDAMALASATLRPDTVKLAAQVDPDTVEVEADRVQVQQVMFNLVRNAVEAMEQSPRREVMLRSAAVGDDMVEVSIADTGPGLPAVVRDRLFQPFVTTKSNGMGIGLSICRSIIESHGGRLWAEDNPDGGTVFRFTLRRLDGGRPTAGL